MAAKAQKQRPAAGTDSPRNRRRTVTGVVVADRMNKTITVKIERMIRHPKFGKYVRRYTKCKAHDEKNEAQVGDLVELMETRPLSATKRWRLVRLVRRGAVVAPVETPAS